jgi:hypothetical protein
MSKNIIKSVSSKRLIGWEAGERQEEGKFSN